jgi:tRNA-2-methylthio-N6-dimethylallyladenosine synthase
MDQGGAQHSLHPTEPETPGSRRGLHVITWGCQMNVYDSGRMEDLLDPLGFSPVEAPELADLVVLNTCHIRERATEKVFSELGRLRVLQQQRAASGGRMMIALAGCVAQAEGEVILARAPYVDIVLGPQTYHRLPSMLRRAEAGERVVQTEFPAEDKFDYLPEDSAHHRHGALTAFLTIQEGCDKFCAFCVVPYTRGWQRRAGWSPAARARSPCSAKTSTPGMAPASKAAPGGSAACCANSPASRASRGCATPPRTRATWMMR